MISKLTLRFVTLGLSALFGFGSAVGAARGLHAKGVGAQGQGRIVDDPAFPPHPWLTAGRTFQVQLRHSPGITRDHAGKDLFGVGLRFAGQGEDSPLDLILNTGECNHFWDAWTFLSLLRQASPEGFKNFLQSDPLALENARGAFRRAPESFSKLRYYSQNPMWFKADDGAVRLVKFRLVAADLTDETGIPQGEDLAAPWQGKRLDGEERPRDYLNAEWSERLHSGPIEYRVQVQIHDKDPSDPGMHNSPKNRWDPDTHPWLDMAIITLDSPLVGEDLERLQFRVGRLPQGIEIVEAGGMDCPYSIPWMRDRIYPAAQLGRRIGYALRGLPSS